MSTYTQILYQIVYSTKHRHKTLFQNDRSRLFAYMAGTIKDHNCHPYQINGVDDHLHIVTHLHPSVSLSDLVKDLKLSSTDLIKKDGLFENFGGWQDGYAAFTYAYKDKMKLINYVVNQETHHKKITFVDELITLLNENGIAFEEKYLL